MDHALRTPGNVAEVAPQCADVPFFDFRVELSIAADGIDEVLKMRGVSARTRALGGFIPFEVVDGVSASLDIERSVFAVEREVVFRFRGRPVVPASVLPSYRDRARGRGEIVGDSIGVRRFLIVIDKPHLRSCAGDALGIGEAESPAGDVEHVDAVVAEFAVSPMPKPMPVVVHVVGAEFLFGSRTLPQGPIEPSGHGSGHAFANGWAAVEIVRPCAEDAADFSRPESVHGFAKSNP